MADLTYDSYKSLENEHRDVTYYSQHSISLVLSKGLSQTMREQPRNPVEYFANWLLKYNSVQKENQKRGKDDKETQKLIDVQNEKLKEEEKKAEEANKEVQR
jgi:hypothetical protein